MPVFSARPVATGVRATIVPTLVPIEREMKQEAIKMPANNKLSGRMCKVRSHLFGALCKSPGQNKDPDHQHDILIGGSYRELIDPLIQL